MNKEITPPAGFVDRYDHMILSEEMRTMYGDSGFYNVGEWSKDPQTLDAACHELVLKHLDLVEKDGEPARILDAGCGLGSGSAVIARRFNGAGVVAINVSEKQLSFARQRYPGINFLAMDAARMDFPPGYFDLIISVEAVFHFNTRTDFLKHAFRILRPGGHLIFSDMLFNDTSWVGTWAVPEANGVTGIEDHRKLCTHAGFQVMHHEDISQSSIRGFCNYLRSVLGMSALADGLKNSIIAYLLVDLKK